MNETTENFTFTKIPHFIKATELVVFPRQEIIANFWVPKEIVVKTPQIVTPYEGRVYRTGYYKDLDGKVSSFDDLIKQYKDRKIEYYGYGGLYELIAIEIWEDWGDDGHTDYCHKGYLYDWFKQEKPLQEYNFFESSREIMDDIRMEKYKNRKRLNENIN